MIVGKLLITGCCHSGTHFVAEMLKRAGYSVAHEQAYTPTRALDPEDWPADIEVSWPGAAYNVGGQTTVFMLIRHPLDVARSMRNRNLFDRWNIYTELASRVCGAEILQCSHPELALWLFWNRVALSQADRVYRVEDFEKPEEREELVRRAGLIVGAEPRSMDWAIDTEPQNVWHGENIPYNPIGFPWMEELNSLAKAFEYVVKRT